MQYTASSFAEPLQRVFDDVLRPDVDVQVSHLSESRYLIDKVSYRARVLDAIEERLYAPVVRTVVAAADRIRRAHTGSPACLPRLRFAGLDRRPGGCPMSDVTVPGTLGALLQLVPSRPAHRSQSGVTRQARARLEGRAGPGVLQPWRELRKLLGKQRIRPDGTTIVFAAAPAVLAGSTLLLAVIVPIVTVGSPFGRVADLFAVVGLLLLGTVALALAGLDTGTAFGGMGSSREMTIAALAEPAILLAIFGLSIPVHSSNLAVIVSAGVQHPARLATPGAALAAAALVIVVLAETGRLPVDNPSTHLELTMVHEAMVLEYAGPQLALVEWAAAMRLTVLLALLANLFVPLGIAGARPGALDLIVATLAITAKVGVLSAAVGAGEVFLAKLRLFRVPELLAGSFLLGLLAVGTSYFLSTTGGVLPQ